MSLLTLKGINSGYGKKQVIFDINYELGIGETAILVGANGSGKSTMLKTIAGFLPLIPGETGRIGKIEFNSKLISPLQRHCNISEGLMYIPQNDMLFNGMTVKKNIECSLLHIPKSKVRTDKVECVFEELDILKPFANTDVRKLSGGMRKMVSLGFVIANSPKLLLYDEPLAGLSEENVLLTADYFKKLNKSGASMLLVEHRVGALIGQTSDIIGLENGRLYGDKLKTLSDIKKFIL